MKPENEHDESASAAGSSSNHRIEAPQPESFLPRHVPGRPNYMTVGTGSTPEAAARLVSMLDQDSGYGGSLDNGENSAPRWHSGILEDRPTPSHTPGLPGDNNAASENERRVVASHVLQLYYNQNKTALGRAIHGTIDTLKRFQEMNMKWPAHYPSVQSEQSTTQSRNDPRPGLNHTQSTLDNNHSPVQSPSRPRAPRRAGTSLGEDSTVAESSSAAAHQPAPEPRLVTPQLAQDFSVLKLELKMGGRNQSDLVHSLEKGSIASLLDGQIQQSIRHLGSLKERIEDTASKVLVTGDLNAGKSTFCNALLRRKVLPEDQQPCTSIFCEVLDYRENAGVEEVHAVPIGSVYNRHDESTYTVFSIKELEKIVIDNEHFSQCKIYIKDIRSVDESLLNNGVVDIALIDAPGLNNDSLKTTAIFARQEEIDVVVFVVSAANHFTQSAKEFIFNAAREKAYIFMVVNGYDNIKDKQRCQEMILKQVAHLSPATFKESSELVHFVSSNAIPVAPSGAPGGGHGPGGSASGSSGGAAFSDDPDGDDDDELKGKHGEPGSPGGKGKGKEREKLQDFEELESSLRRFVLEKRARSKLAPAKTYLLNLLGDVNNLALVNRDVAQAELERVKTELDEVMPAYEQSKKARTEAGEAVEHEVEVATSEVYSHTRDTVNSSIERVAEQDLGIPYPGLWSAYQYAEDIRNAMLQEITWTVHQCEEHARNRAVQGFNGIKNLGILHLGNKLYADVMFLPERMYRKPMHALARQVDVEVELWDFFDVANLWERQEKVAGTGMAMTVAGVVGGRLVGGVGWMDGAVGAAKILGSNNMRRLIIPGLIATVAIGVSYALTSIPRSLPRRLSTKLSAQLAALDYTHSNALRISSEVRRALKGPASDLRIGLQRNVEKLQVKKEETSKSRAEAEVARKYFSNLVRESNDIRHGVQRMAQRDPRPLVLLIIFLLILNTPEPQQQGLPYQSRYEQVLTRERDGLHVLNTTRYDDFDSGSQHWLNLTGFREDDGLAWELLSPVKERARAQTTYLLGEEAEKVLDGSVEEDGYPAVYQNVTGYVQGEWVKSQVGRGVQAPRLNLSAIAPDQIFPLWDFDRNLTGNSGDVRFHFSEVDHSRDTAENNTISSIIARMVIGEDSSMGNWWEVKLHGVHFVESGGILLSTTSEKFAGIFALPHFTISENQYLKTQTLLNRTIQEVISRQESQPFPLWNPWNSATEPSETMFPPAHCEYVVYLQQHPVAFRTPSKQYPTSNPYYLHNIEHEIRFPTGSPLPGASPLSMSMMAFSPDCGFVIESKGPPDYARTEALHLRGAKVEIFMEVARRSTLVFVLTLAVQLMFLVKQMKETSTPSTRNRVSFYSVAIMALGDGFWFLTLVFVHVFLDESLLVLYATAFMALFSVVFELRFLMDIWTIQATERRRQQRQDASTSSTTPERRATPSPSGAQSNQPVAPIVSAAGVDTLPLPVTANRPVTDTGATPIIIPSDQDLDPATENATTTATTPGNVEPVPTRAELGTLYTRYCLLLIVFFFITLHAGSWPTAARSVFCNTVCFIYLSFWCPQIYRNVMRNCRKALRWDYVLGQSLARLVPLSYLYAVSSNIIFSQNDLQALMVLVGWVGVQIFALLSQEILGPRFFVKEGWAPPAYDYHPVLREDEEGAMMPIGSTQVSEDDPGASTKQGEAMDKDKGKKIFDCTICTQDVEVSIIPSGGSVESNAGIGGNILARRAYMVTPCRHIFHTPCLEGWMRYRLQCPNCREILPPL
ncbi:hypothetical protein BU16DRAFT_499041 [Lophium mytilinum]|uniref:DSC E3 ubiquitin ligase complex subunit A n=1 Tax=Lophium mytilinum TaxID=390894 RepID=A0A6A6RDW5_9PEZI|nr:hypothetical protein BU16DRAFT_499041 [Lophium mytilinum]